MNKAKTRIIDQIKGSKKKPLDIKEVIDLIKDNPTKALAVLLKEMSAKDRVSFLMKEFANSKWRSYTLPMSRLQDIVNIWVATGSTVEAYLYLSEINKQDKIDLRAESFESVRKYLLSDLVHNNSEHTYLGLVYIADCKARNYDYYSSLTDNFESKRNTIVGKYVAELAAIKWPNSSAFQVLYG